MEERGDESGFAAAASEESGEGLDSAFASSNALENAKREKAKVLKLATAAKMNFLDIEKAVKVVTGDE